MSDSTPILTNWQEILTLLPLGWEGKAKELGALLRKRGIASAEVLLRVLLIHLATGKSLRTSVAYAQSAGLCGIADTTLLERLRGAGRWLAWLCQELLKESSLAPAWERFDFSNRRIRLVDGTTISEQGSTGSDWRVHYSLNLATLGCDFFEVTESSVGENLARIPVEAEDIMVADRGFCSGKEIKWVKDSQGDIVVRYCGGSLGLFSPDGTKFSFIDSFRGLEVGQPAEFAALIRPPKSNQPLPVRLCVIKKTPEKAEKALQAARREAAKKKAQIQEKTEVLAHFVVLVTTLPPEVLSTAACLDLYRCRWQVELAFKQMKQLMRLGHLPKYDPESCKAWIQGKFLIALLTERLHLEAERFSPWGYGPAGEGYARTKSLA